MKTKSTNITLSIWTSLFFLTCFLGMRSQTFGQQNLIDKASYEFVMKKTAQLVYQDLKQYPDELMLVENSLGNNYTNTVIGWLINKNNDGIYLMTITGQEEFFSDSSIIKKEKIKLNESIFPILKEYHMFRGYQGCEVVSYCLISLWLNQNNHQELSMKLLSQINKGYFSNEPMVSSFGNLYYNEMLIAYSIDRDFKKTIEFGEIFKRKAYDSFEYRQTAISLTNQLEGSMDDFQRLALPNSIAWMNKKLELSREQQFNYLLDRLHILNCIQLGQPMDIDLGMEQTSISYKDLPHDSDHFKDIKKFEVINPYTELISMNPTLKEITFFLPYLLDSSYIPTYSYWRSFSSSRTLYQFNWLVESLIYELTNKRFFDIKTFNKLTIEEKNKEIEQIKIYCNENQDLGDEDRVVKIMANTNDWREFKNAMYIALENKDTSITSILEKRFNDFTSKDYQNPQVEIAKAMFQIGSKKNIETVRYWFASDDKSIKLWSSLFLINYDPEYYNEAFDTLSNLLQSVHGFNFYTASIETLLSLEDPKALVLAEGILDNKQFQFMFYMDEYFQNLIKMLLLAKSEKAFDFLYSGLTNYNKDNGLMAKDEDGKEKLILSCDKYIWFVQYWRGTEPIYDQKWRLEKRKDYGQGLANWLAKQFKLIKNDQKSEIIQSSNKINQPVQVLDSPGGR